MGKFVLFEPPKKPPAPPRPKPPPPPSTLFEQLLPCKWRDVEFPVSTIKVALAQDIAEHKYWGRDGADVESTGRAPLEIDAVIPCYNGIVPGKGEKWGILYPTVFRKLLDAFADRSKGSFQHPELGIIACKPVSLEFTIDAQRRDGVEVTCKWVETFDDDEAFKFDADRSPIQVANLAALNLDASKAPLQALVTNAELPGEDFVSLMNKVTGFVDTVTTAAQVIGNKPNQVLFRLEKLQNSVLRAKNALTWPIIDNIEKAKGALLDINEALSSRQVASPGAAAGQTVNAGRKMGRFFTPTTMTASAVQASLPTQNTTMDELLALNPVLLAKPEVGAQTVIRYYV